MSKQSLLAGFLLAFAVSPAYARWLANGNPVTGEISNSYRCAVTPDGTGGAFVAWDGIRGQHFTASGEYAEGWPSEGRLVGEDRLAPGSYGYSMDATLLADGEGGFYAVWHRVGEYCTAQCSFEPGAIHVVRRTSSGGLAPGWPDTSVRVSTRLIGAYDSPLVASNGNHGILIAWEWEYGGVQVQSVDSRGERRWGLDGIRLAGSSSVGSLPQIASDEHGGAFAFWVDSRGLTTGARIFGQHLAEDGRLLWGPDGIPISDVYPSLAETSPAAVPDGAQGMIVVWIEGRDAPYALHATRVTRAGTRPWGHDLSLSAPGRPPAEFVAADAPQGGALVAWSDCANNTCEARAQRIRHDGRLEWSPGGVPVCAAPGRRGPISLAPAGDGGAFIAWGDSRPEFELYATRITEDGGVAPGWLDGGTPVSARLPTRCGGSSPGWLSTMHLVSVGDRRGMIAWSDVRAASAIYNCVDQTQTMLLGPDGPAASPVQANEGSEAKDAASPGSGASDGAAVLRLSISSPAERGTTVRLVLPEASPATLELYDLAGRRLWMTRFAIGSRERSVSLADGAWLPPGLYFLRLAQGARLATTRFTVLP